MIACVRRSARSPQSAARAARSTSHTAPSSAQLIGQRRVALQVARQFTATEPNRLWVTDLTFVPMWTGVAYVCFINDAFSRMLRNLRPFATANGSPRSGALPSIGTVGD